MFVCVWYNEVVAGRLNGEHYDNPDMEAGSKPDTLIWNTLVRKDSKHEKPSIWPRKYSA